VVRGKEAGPLFSILVASYNNGRYLGELYESVLAQSYSNWELIVADDASSDESFQIINGWLSNPRVRVEAHHTNRGAGAAFRSAANLATGEIMGMLGADDALRQDALAQMVDAHLAQPGASLINSDLVICDQSLQPTGAPTPFHPLDPGATLMQEVCISSFATFKTSAYRKTSGFDASLRRAVDHDIYLKLEEVGDVGYVASPLYLYRSHPGGISQGDNGTAAAQSAILAKCAAYQRRKGTNLPNITHREYRQLRSVYERREAQRYGRSKPLRGLTHLARAAILGRLAR
jgi:glycosyltransferase involved in cell wall biosynthesis